MCRYGSQQPIEESRFGLHTLQGYRHLLLIIRYKHRKYQGGLLMASYTSMYTRSKKGIKMRMDTTIGLYNKGNEIIFWRSLCVESCLILSGNCHCMCCHCRSMLHQIWTSRIGNDNVRQSSKSIFGDDNIHSFLCVVGEKMRNLFLYVGSTF